MHSEISLDARNKYHLPEPNENSLRVVTFYYKLDLGILTLYAMSKSYIKKILIL